MKKETQKGIYNCRYCGKDLTSFSCDCEDSKNSNIWKAQRKNKVKKGKKVKESKN